jgi:hypothetical protein
MGPKTRRLIEILDQIVAILDADGEKQWRKSMASAQSQLAKGDLSGVDQVLGGFGGMGSFNDLVVGQSHINGQFCWKEGAQEANARLDDLRAEAFRVASFIRHNPDREQA